MRKAARIKRRKGREREEGKNISQGGWWRWLGGRKRDEMEETDCAV